MEKEPILKKEEIETLPGEKIIMVLLLVTMIAFYATTFDALTMVVSSYSMKSLAPDENPGKGMRVFWSVLFILLPIALLYSESSMSGLQSVSIIAAFSIRIIVF